MAVSYWHRPDGTAEIGENAERVASENSFASVSARWLEHWQEGKSPRHVDSTRRRLASNILPSLGALQIAEIKTPDVVAMIRAIEARGARDIAKRALETTGQIFRYATTNGYAERNPVADVRPRDILKASQRRTALALRLKSCLTCYDRLRCIQGRMSHG